MMKKTAQRRRTKEEILKAKKEQENIDETLNEIKKQNELLKMQNEQLMRSQQPA
jgi:hypothetical protein